MGIESEFDEVYAAALAEERLRQDQPPAAEKAEISTNTTNTKPAGQPATEVTPAERAALLPEAALEQKAARQAVEKIGKLVHDLNNPLTGTIGWSSMIGEGLPLDDPAKTASATISAAHQELMALYKPLMKAAKVVDGTPRDLENNLGKFAKIADQSVPDVIWLGQEILRNARTIEQAKATDQYIEHLRAANDLTAQRLQALITESPGQLAALHGQQVESVTAAEKTTDQSVNIDELAKKSVSTLDHYARDKEVTLSLSVNPQSIHGELGISSDHVSAVMVNLIKNAVEATPFGGRVNTDVTHDAIANHPDLKPGQYTILTITDTGAGMDKETQEKIFQPFFTTKEGKGGTGLGLSSVKEMVEEAGGKIFVESKLGQGSTFTVYLPEREKPQERRAAA